MRGKLAIPPKIPNTGRNSLESRSFSLGSLHTNSSDQQAEVIDLDPVPSSSKRQTLPSDAYLYFNRLTYQIDDKEKEEQKIAHLYDLFLSHSCRTPSLFTTSELSSILPQSHEPLPSSSRSLSQPSSVVISPPVPSLSNKSTPNATQSSNSTKEPILVPSIPVESSVNPLHPSWSVNCIPPGQMPSAQVPLKTFPSPLKSISPSPRDQLGHCIVIRPEGATVRNGPDIDNSIVLCRIPYHEEFYFCHQQCLLPPDEDCVEVIRLQGYVSQQLSQVFSLFPSHQELWISLTGRNIDDHEPIVTITRYPQQQGAINLTK